MHTTEYDIIQSPIGELLVEESNGYIVLVDFIDDNSKPLGLHNKNNKLLQTCVTQLREYFAGQRKRFDLPITFTKGTLMQKSCWKFLQTIPYANTVSYQEEAKAIGNERATRFVGNANGKNPIAIIVPCHRIIGKNGKLTGYGGGVWRKQWLLEHEKKHINS